MAEEIAEAFYAARVHRGPVVLNLPMDLQEEEFDWDYDYRPSTQFLPPRVETPSPDLLAPVIEKLIAAERPVIIAGTGATRRERQGRDHQAGRSRRRAAGDVAAGQGLFRRPSLGRRHRRRLRLGAVGSSLLADADFVLGRRRGAWLLHDRRRPAVPRRRGRPHRHQADARGNRRHSRPVCPGRRTQEPSPRSTRRWKPARSARKASAPPRRAPCWTRRRTGSNRRRTAWIRAPLAWNLGAALPKGALFTCGAGHFFSWIGMYIAAAGRRGDPVLLRLRRGRSGHRRRDRHRCRQSRTASTSRSRATAA